MTVWFCFQMHATNARTRTQLISSTTCPMFHQCLKTTLKIMCMNLLAIYCDFIKLSYHETDSSCLKFIKNKLENTWGDLIRDNSLRGNLLKAIAKVLFRYSFVEIFIKFVWNKTNCSGRKDVGAVSIEGSCMMTTLTRWWSYIGRRHYQLYKHGIIRDSILR